MKRQTDENIFHDEIGISKSLINAGFVRPQEIDDGCLVSHGETTVSTAMVEIAPWCSNISVIVEIRDLVDCSTAGNTISLEKQNTISMHLFPMLWLQLCTSKCLVFQWGTFKDFKTSIFNFFLNEWVVQEEMRNTSVHNKLETPITVQSVCKEVERFNQSSVIVFVENSSCHICYPCWRECCHVFPPSITVVGKWHIEPPRIGLHPHVDTHFGWIANSFILGLWDFTNDGEGCVFHNVSLLSSTKQNLDRFELCL